MVQLIAEDTPARQAWRNEVREFLDRELPRQFRWAFDTNDDDQDWAEALAFWRKVGSKGWVGLTWPKEYYGLERDALDKWILEDEFYSRGAPGYPVVGLGVADAVMRLGTDEQRKQHLKGIASGEVLWAEGFTEPNSGTDLASLQTRAERDGDEWVLNGEKTFGTAAHRCQWMYVLARTDPSAPKHAGITCFLVPLDAAGITMRPLRNMARGRQNVTYFENVRLPLDAQVGDLNQAWQQVWFRMGGEHLDRGGPGPSPFRRQIGLLLDDVLQYCRETRRNGAPIIEDPVVRQQLAEAVIGVEALKLLEQEAFWRWQSGEPAPIGPALAYLVDGYYKELWPRFAQTCMEVLGPRCLVSAGRWAPLAGAVEQFYRGSFGNHGGGTSQVKRMVMATRGLGLPR